MNEHHREIERMFKLFGDDLYHFLVYYKGSHDVEDDVQEVFFRALKSHFRSDSHPKTWLIGIARRLVIDQRRKKRLLSWLPKPERQKSPDDILMEHENVREVYRAIDELKTEYRDVVMLRVISDLSVEETSEVLGWTREKVSRTYYRALKKLDQNRKDAIKEGGAELES
ncbi:RNA polymerase sigma factor [Bacillus sp. V2I10]|uniref:RNA polymerase sigma factor n=1 Tax=Bacillus sp. V2I10 TaxID=3042276 RepID=UPI002785E630|nr:RNA polymerase sigma factor [Bacillus sp. V2I10]MDQ0857473.1 RNA polymerase sigma-70 factor (ECF subfamily) [Bacillus sp. V2I10]